MHITSRKPPAEYMPGVNTYQCTAPRGMEYMKINSWALFLDPDVQILFNLAHAFKDLLSGVTSQ